MIGRGKRSDEACKNKQWLPGYKKENFLIIDYWQNFEHFNMMPKDEQEGAQQIPIPVTIFKTRLSKLELLIGNQQSANAKRVIADLRADIAKLPLDSFTVKQQLKDICDVFEEEWWQYLNIPKIEFLRMKVGPLLRFASASNLAETFFISKMERISYSVMQQKDVEFAAAITRMEVDLLPRNLPQIAPHAGLINDMLGVTWWEPISTLQIGEARKTLAPLMKYKREKPPCLLNWDWMI